MVPNMSKAGTSFKGAAAYHGHDKGRATTSERVEWFATRNILTDDPKTAERVMIATALDQDRLKRESGTPNTGRKSKAHVQTLSLSWSPDEQVDRAEMERAADQAIKVLGVEEHQVAIYAHNDTAHPHVHLVVNRVHPETGKLATFSNSYRKLDTWANSYERERGQIVTGARDDKHRRQAAAAERHPDARSRRTYAEGRRAEAARRGEAATATMTQNQRSILAARQQDMRARHKAQWAELRDRHQGQRDREYQIYRQRVAAEREVHEKARRASSRQRKVEWGKFYSGVRAAEHHRRKLEWTPHGLLALAITAALEERRQGSKEGLARLTWAHFSSRRRREAVFENVVARDKKALIDRQNFARDKALEHLSSRRAEEIQFLRDKQTHERDVLKRTQDAERATIRADWRDLNDRRDRLARIHNSSRQGRGNETSRAAPSSDRGREQARANLDRLREATGRTSHPRSRGQDRER
ncbi:MAG: relaxase/mobilization nuclease domain-containing protein [Pseudomonadota bacterium]